MQVPRARRGSASKGLGGRRASRLKTEVERLAKLPPAEWMFYLDDIAKKHDIPPAKLKVMIEATIKVADKKAREAKAEEQRLEQRAEKKRQTEQKEQQRTVVQLQRQQERDQQRADKEDEKKALARDKERDKEFANIIKLPGAEHEARLTALAKRLDKELDVLRDEFAMFVELEETRSPATMAIVESWPEPVDTKALLAEVTKQVKRYVALYDDDITTAVVLWIAFAWLHEAIAVYSPMLLIKAAGIDAGKTTLSSVIGFLTPRAQRAAAITGPSLFRLVDHLHPTLIIDNADDLFKRKPDLVEIVSASWTRGHKIPRAVPHGDVHFFDPFCPKIITGVNPHMDKQTRSRCIPVELLPKLTEREVEDFKHVDDENFITLRRKLKRWADDNTPVLMATRPPTAGLNNRAAMNWCLQLAIAALAGGDWTRRAHKAAVKLSRERRDPSDSYLALAAFHAMFTKHGPEIVSADAQRWLTADPTSVWADYRGHGPISQRQIAVLLGQYGIHPAVIHPTGRRAERGYKVEWFEIAFRHWLRKAPPCKRTTVRSRGKQRK
jgi:putative DNA primase/helicase